MSGNKEVPRKYSINLLSQKRREETEFPSWEKTRWGQAITLAVFGGSIVVVPAVCYIANSLLNP